MDEVFGKDSGRAERVMGESVPAVDRGHAMETIAAVIGDLELTRIAIGTATEDSRVPAAAKLRALAGELADLAAILLC